MLPTLSADRAAALSLDATPQRHVTVKDPEQRSELFRTKTFTSYLVETQAIDPDTAADVELDAMHGSPVASVGTEHVHTSRVQRRFSDFEWLRRKLVRRYAGVIVPPLPRKDYLSRNSAATVAERQRLLTRFLRRLVARAPLAHDSHVLQFLSHEQFHTYQKEVDEIDAAADAEQLATDRALAKQFDLDLDTSNVGVEVGTKLVGSFLTMVQHGVASVVDAVRPASASPSESVEEDEEFGMVPEEGVDDDDDIVTLVPRHRDECARTFAEYLRHAHCACRELDEQVRRLAVRRAKVAATWNEFSVAAATIASLEESARLSRHLCDADATEALRRAESVRGADTQLPRWLNTAASVAASIAPETERLASKTAQDVAETLADWSAYVAAALEVSERRRSLRTKVRSLHEAATRASDAREQWRQLDDRKQHYLRELQVLDERLRHEIAAFQTAYNVEMTACVRRFFQMHHDNVRAEQRAWTEALASLPPQSAGDRVVVSPRPSRGTPSAFDMSGGVFRLASVQTEEDKQRLQQPQQQQQQLEQAEETIDLSTLPKRQEAPALTPPLRQVRPVSACAFLCIRCMRTEW
ncbi:MAG: hypothetical protein MHM6MM_007234 [Cercozoa sp. M6MM]